MRALLAAAGALLLLLAGPGAAATTVLRARPTADTALPGIGHAPTFDVDQTALARLRTATTARLDGFPVGRRSRVLDLERFDPLADARLEVVGPDGTRPLSRPDLAFFRGRLSDEPTSIAIVTASRTGLRALVLGAEGVSVVGPDTDGTHRAWSLADVDADTWKPPAAFCMNDLVDLAHPGAVSAALSASPPATGASHLGMRRAQVAIETDQELRAKFASDDEALAYVASVFVEASAIYERDIEVALDLSYVRIWSASDPWTASAPDGQLGEVRGYWNNPSNGMDAIAGPRDLVHMISGKPVLGGIAYIDAVCNASYGYGVSQVYGSFDTSDPRDVWDLVVVMHELGHNFGTEHTHCYSPPIDTCYSGEPGCWSGAETPSQGTIMSYCHLHSGGLANIDLRFHARVLDVLHATTAAQGCLELDSSSPCGNGTLDTGEECDDGNRTSGDGCSSGCGIEACGNGTLDLSEGCDDGNTDAGDGCSATCHVERCAFLIPHQSVWSSARLLVKPGGTGRSGLTFRAAFEIPSNAILDATDAGLTLLGETATGGTGLSIAVPGGDGWSARGGRVRYRNPSGAVEGVKKIIVTTKPRGDRARVKIVVVGSGGDYPETLGEMPARLTVVLGGDDAGATGACGEWQPTQGSCRSERGGKRLACR